MTLRCRILGHKVVLENCGGAIFQVCARNGCTWVGRCVMDEFADPATKAEIIALNKKHGCLKILPRHLKVTITAREV